MSDQLKGNPSLKKFHFQVRWNGNTFGFTEVTGLKRSTDVVTHREGGNLSTGKQKMPGLRKFSNITMKRGIVVGNSEELQQFRANSIEKSKVSGTASIVLVNENHEPVQTWQLKNATIKKVVSADLNAVGNEVAIEILELTHEGLEAMDPK